ncbi:geranylgeranylglyceryl/heptaprenylglyceryl phosphate synthase [Flavobacterium sp. HXWNR69]|uniref:Geranylgeranylglyceryl phosphate synthase n=1 Tax=Flavobacterium fragile TaxID=2949085 RepID=A0ABT0TE01_9FLAO|nr:geranylgeranylglyceryl/heptaprenylglyceryl phosphate synthase [Flavobacterium sp. HXWNR69]MCL9768841.1 geranylgeranylglyceryl/heptaprenylglyceryl phosphate synthase [Flavobacterium sp. HXWNR69]
MQNLFQHILQAKNDNRKLLAVLIDPEKVSIEKVSILSDKIKASPATHIFVGGSTFSGTHLDDLIALLKNEIQLPILIFPGHPSQISNEADGILFLSLLSGRNPEYLIEHHINSVEALEKSNLEIIPTGYLLIDGGKETAVQRVSQTQPIEQDNIELAYKTAKAGEFLGKKLIYLEAGSGANQHVPLEMIHYVSQNIRIPLIVGGGIRSIKTIRELYDAGADLVVIGTAFENDPNFFGI